MDHGRRRHRAPLIVVASTVRHIGPAELRPIGIGEPLATHDVADRSAIVTGAGSGIGRRAVALLPAANGAAVLVHDLTSDAADKVVQEVVDAGGTAAAFVGDAADEDVAVAAVEAAEALAPLRIAVDNAGIGGPDLPVGEYPTEAWCSVIDVNLDGVFYGMRAQSPAIAAH
ncbi:SDR family NAD(P)-dependent oxidoreductase [Actinomycetospora endophytica]|uniref:SDR family NAD(P)-dependent oxidoreductase n=1 Tax=Actinomycetospora endophytica TaxID=2291215 RepID=UPI0027E3AC50|nr:SDR family NAD(P)-dependent oxidoreductase [Actinomycetospora endophytica]